jgi:O-antigen/teichoic acid export membrane protein
MRSLPFFKGLSFLLVLNVLVKPAWIFLIDRQIQNQVGNETYGKYFAVLNLSYILFFITDAGLSGMMNQRIANYGATSVKLYLKIKILFSAVYILACCSIAWVTKLDQWQMLFYIIGIQLLTSMLIFLRSIITAHQHFTTDAWFSIIDKALMILFCAGFIYYPLFSDTITVQLFLRIQLFCTALATILAMIFVIKQKWISTGSEENLSSVIKTILPFAAIILLMSMHYRMDGFLLERIHPNGAYEAGIYASGYRLLDAGNMVGYLVAAFLVPFIARNQFKKDLIEEALLNIRHVLLFFGIGAACFSLLFSAWIQQLLYYTNNPYTSRVIQLCVTVLPAYLLMHIYGSVLTALMKFREIILILIASVLINLLLNLFLIPFYGAIGSCTAALTSQYFCALCCYVVATKSLRLPILPRSNLLYLATALVLCLFFYFARVSMLNVWFILGCAVCFMIVLLLTQITYLKKSFINIH